MKFKVTKGSSTHRKIERMQAKIADIEKKGLRLAQKYGFDGFVKSTVYYADIVGFGFSENLEGNKKHKRFKESKDYPKWKNIGYQKYRPKRNFLDGKKIAKEMKEVGEVSFDILINAITSSHNMSVFKGFGFEKAGKQYLISGNEKWDFTVNDDLEEITVTEYKRLKNG